MVSAKRFCGGIVLSRIWRGKRIIGSRWLPTGTGLAELYSENFTIVQSGFVPNAAVPAVAPTTGWAATEPAAIANCGVPLAAA